MIKELILILIQIQFFLQIINIIKIFNSYYKFISHLYNIFIHRISSFKIIYL